VFVNMGFYDFEVCHFDSPTEIKISCTLRVTGSVTASTPRAHREYTVRTQ